MATLEDKIAQLPPAARKEIGDIVEYFLWKYASESTETTQEGEADTLKQLLHDAREKLLSLEDDWDDRGAKTIEEGTFQRAESFLLNLQTKLQSESTHWVDPEIFPGTKGEILIQWKSDSFQLAIVIPENTSDPATYYATDYGKNEDEGTASTERLNSLYINWARQFE